MLKSDHITVGASADLIVWRWRKPAPYELLFCRNGATCFYTKRRDAVQCHIVAMPHGALEVAVRIAASADAAALVAEFVKDGVVAFDDKCEMPYWAEEGVLIDLLTPPEVRAAYAAPLATLDTLEF